MYNTGAVFCAFPHENNGHRTIYDTILGTRCLCPRSGPVGLPVEVVFEHVTLGRDDCRKHGGHQRQDRKDRRHHDAVPCVIGAGRNRFGARAKSRVPGSRRREQRGRCRRSSACCAIVLSVSVFVGFTTCITHCSPVKSAASSSSSSLSDVLYRIASQDGARPCATQGPFNTHIQASTLIDVCQFQTRYLPMASETASPTMANYPARRNACHTRSIKNAIDSGIDCVISRGLPSACTSAAGS